MTPAREEQPGHQKLLLIITADSDAERVIRRLAERGFPATKIASTGGFLRKGNATILSGVDAEQVDGVLAMVREETHARKEYVPLQALPFLGEGAYLPEQLQVRVGGAIIFVLSVERFERT